MLSSTILSPLPYIFLFCLIVKSFNFLNAVFFRKAWLPLFLHSHSFPHAMSSVVGDSRSGETVLSGSTLRSPPLYFSEKYGTHEGARHNDCRSCSATRSSGTVVTALKSRSKYCPRLVEREMETMSREGYLWFKCDQFSDGYFSRLLLKRNGMSETTCGFFLVW